MWKRAFKKLEVMWCLSTPYHFKFFKGCLLQILRGPFLNTLTDIYNIRERKSNGNPILHKDKNMSSNNKKLNEYEYFKFVI